MARSSCYELKKDGLSVFERVRAAHTVMSDINDVTGTVDESYSNNTDHKPHLLSKSIAKLASDTRCKIERPLPDFSFLTNTDVEGSF